jgi:hypothetical protein
VARKAIRREDGCGWRYGQDFCRLIPHRVTETVGAHRRSAAGMPAEKRPPGIFHLHERGRGGAGPAEPRANIKKRRRHNSSTSAETVWSSRYGCGLSCRHGG